MTLRIICFLALFASAHAFKQKCSDCEKYCGCLKRSTEQFQEATKDDKLMKQVATLVKCEMDIWNDDSGGDWEMMHQCMVDEGYYEDYSTMDHQFSIDCDQCSAKTAVEKFQAIVYTGVYGEEARKRRRRAVEESRQKRSAAQKRRQARSAPAPLLTSSMPENMPDMSKLMENMPDMSKLMENMPTELNTMTEGMDIGEVMSGIDMDKIMAGVDVDKIMEGMGKAMEGMGDNMVDMANGMDMGSGSGMGWDWMDDMGSGSGMGLDWMDDMGSGSGMGRESYDYWDNHWEKQWKEQDEKIGKCVKKAHGEIDVEKLREVMYTLYELDPMHAEYNCSDHFCGYREAEQTCRDKAGIKDYYHYMEYSIYDSGRGDYSDSSGHGDHGSGHGDHGSGHGDHGSGSGDIYDWYYGVEDYGEVIEENEVNDIICQIFNTCT